MKNKTSQSGFTLIELIAVMVILGILAAVIIPRISTITSGAYESNVRAMYGLIKNEVNAQAIKAAMTGGASGHLERYPNPTTTTVNNYLSLWVNDYDPDMWTQFCAASGYENRTGATPENTGAVLFMYHPHGQPNAAITWAETSALTPTGATAQTTSKEDIYWIYYAPRTSTAGSAAGREMDGYVMAAWVGNVDWTFDGDMVSAGTTTQTNEAVIADLVLLVGN